jgi:hypothetical protein
LFGDVLRSVAADQVDNLSECSGKESSDAA